MGRVSHWGTDAPISFWYTNTCVSFWYVGTLIASAQTMPQVWHEHCRRHLGTSFAVKLFSSYYEKSQISSKVCWVHAERFNESTINQEQNMNADQLMTIMTNQQAQLAMDSLERSYTWADSKTWCDQFEMFVKRALLVAGFNIEGKLHAGTANAVFNRLQKRTRRYI